MFTRAIVKQPCRNMINGISENNLGAPDYALAVEQHAAYVATLEKCGLQVTILPPDEEFPDSTFIEDTCLITRKCAVLTRPGAHQRRGETARIARTVKEIGLPVETIKSPGTLDAGDVMMVSDHFYIGLSDRTNPLGAGQLIDLLERYGLTGSTVDLESVLHLKTGVSYLENNTLLAYGEFLHKEQFRAFNRLPVQADEAYAANSVWINDVVIVPEGFPHTAEMIETAGYRIEQVDVSEFRKLDGGLSCLSLRF